VNGGQRAGADAGPATLITLRALRAGRVPWAAYGLLGAGTLIRMDMAVPLGALTVFLMLNDRRRFWLHALIGVSVLALFMGPQFALRRWYYGEWLPNTYYLKVAGYPVVLRVLHGLEIAIRLVVRFGLLPFGIFMFRRDRAVRLLAWLAAAQMVYSVYVGGDAREDIGGANRYVALAMPRVFARCSRWRPCEWLSAAVTATSPQSRSGRTANGGAFGERAA
jgi:hypothetical protein